MGGCQLSHSAIVKLSEEVDEVDPGTAIDERVTIIGKQGIASGTTIERIIFAMATELGAIDTEMDAV